MLTWLVVAAAATAQTGNTGAEQACRTLVADYAYYRDRFEAQALAELFTEDGVLVVPDGQLVGRRAIAQRLQQGANAGRIPLIRHFMSNVYIDVAADGRSARGVSYAAVYVGNTTPTPQPLRNPAALGEYHDRFVLTDYGWRIEHRSFIPLWAPVAEQPDE